MLNVRRSILFVICLILAAAPIMAAGNKVNYSVTKPVYVAGVEIQPGKYQVKWETKSPEATVVFILKGKTVATVQGKVEQLQKKSDYNSLIIGKDSAGRDAINALLFRNKDISVVF